MKYINVKKVILVVSTSFIIISMSGCQSKEQPSDIKPNDVVTEYQNNSSNSSKVTADSASDNIIVEKEDEIVTYFEDLETEVDNYTVDNNFEKLKDKVKNIAITGIDFIFYGKEINGITFNELTDETKSKIMSIVASIDNKVESKIPNYKETIKDKFGKSYDYVTDKLHQGLGYVDGKLEDKYGEKYDDVKDKASEIKDDVKDTASNVWDTVKDKTSDGWSKVKDWYEEKTNKR